MIRVKRLSDGGGVIGSDQGEVTVSDQGGVIGSDKGEVASGWK